MRHIALQCTSLLAASHLAARVCSKPQRRAMQAPEVTVAPAIDRDVADWDEFTGHFEAVQAVDVRPRVSGFIQRVVIPRRRDRRAGRRARHDRPATLRSRRRARRGGARAGEDARAAGAAGARARQAARQHAGDLARRARRAHERASPKAPPRCAAPMPRSAMRSSTSSGRRFARRSPVASGAPRSRRAISCRPARRRRRC